MAFLAWKFVQSNSGETETKAEVSRGTSGKVGNALGNLMSENMQNKRRN